MFTSAKDYINFFQNIKNNPQALKKGEIKKYNFEASVMYYILAAGLGSFLFYILSAFLSAFGLLRIVLIPVGYFFFFMTLISFVQLNYYLLKNKESSFKQVWARNMGFLAKLSRSEYLKNKYPETSAFDEKIILEDPENHISKNDFALFIGTSTGLMSQLWHTSSLAKNQNVLLDINDSSKNILVLGGIGSGKTSTIMQPLMLQLIHQGCGGLIFDIKGDVKNTALNFAETTNRHIRILGPSQSKFNLLRMIPPEAASSFLKSPFLLSGGDVSDRLWVDTATKLSRNVLGLLSFIPKYWVKLQKRVKCEKLR